jgi:hypothetical protein
LKKDFSTSYNQGCRSGFELDSDSMLLWIRIPDPGERKKIRKKCNGYGT